MPNCACSPARQPGGRHERLARRPVPAAAQGQRGAGQPAGAPGRDPAGRARGPRMAGRARPRRPAPPAQPPSRPDEGSATTTHRGHGVPLRSSVSLGGAVGLELALYPGPFGAVAVLASAPKIGDAAAWQERAELVRRAGTSVMMSGSAERWFAPGFTDREPVVADALLTSLSETDRESYALAGCARFVRPPGPCRQHAGPAPGRGRAARSGGAARAGSVRGARCVRRSPGL